MRFVLSCEELLNKQECVEQSKIELQARFPFQLPIFTPSRQEVIFQIRINWKSPNSRSIILFLSKHRKMPRMRYADWKMRPASQLILILSGLCTGLCLKRLKQAYVIVKLRFFHNWKDNPGRQLTDIRVAPDFQSVMLFAVISDPLLS